VTAREAFKRAFNLFSPKFSLATREDLLRKFYVPREKKRLERFKGNVVFGPSDGKFLLYGHRGCGKSTELARLAYDDELVDTHFVVFFSITGEATLWDIDYADVLIAIASRLFRTARDKGLSIGEDLLEEVFKWFDEVTKVTTAQIQAEATFAQKLYLLFLELATRGKVEVGTREEIRKKVWRREGELVSKIDKLISAVKIADERRSGKPKNVLIVIDDLDHISKIELAHQIFVEHLDAITAPMCKIVYTVPLSFARRKEFNDILPRFDHHTLLPVVKIRNRDGTVNEENFELLRRVVAKRLPLDFIEGEALDYAINKSGGVLRELIRYLHQSCLTALTKGAPCITHEMIKEVVDERRKVFAQQLEYDDYKVLMGVSPEVRAYRIDDRFRELLFHLSILQYENDDVWYDLHPVVKDLVAEYEANGRRRKARKANDALAR